MNSTIRRMDTCPAISRIHSHNLNNKILSLISPMLLDQVAKIGIIAVNQARLNLSSFPIPGVICSTPAAVKLTSTLLAILLGTLHARQNSFKVI